MPSEYQNLPYVRPAYVPDNSGMMELLRLASQAKQQGILQQGQNTAQGRMNIASLISNALGSYRQEREQKALLEQRAQVEQQRMAQQQQEKQADFMLRAATLQDAEEQRRQASARLAQQDQRQAEQDTRQTAMDLSANVQPGVINGGTADQIRAYPGTAGRVQVLDGAPVLTRTPQQAEQARAAQVAQAAAAATAARQDATDARLTGMAAEAARHNKALENKPSGGSDNEPLATIIGPDGKPIYVRRSDAIGKSPTAGAEKPSSGVQKKTLTFFNRGEQADKDLEGLEPWLATLGTVGQARLEHAPNIAQTPEGRRYTQAQRAFTEARLRKDSGAAIPENEFVSDRKTYFPQTGDDAETLAQKRRARAAILSSLAFESGQALGEFLGDADEAAAVIQTYRQRAVGGRPEVPANTPPAALKPGQTVTIGRYQVKVEQ